MSPLCPFPDEHTKLFEALVRRPSRGEAQGLMHEPVPMQPVVGPDVGPVVLPEGQLRQVVTRLVWLGEQVLVPAFTNGWGDQA